MSVAYLHRSDDAPDPPRLHYSYAQVVAGVAVVADDLIRTGDVVLHIQTSEYWGSGGGESTTFFTYYLVKNVSHPTGVCAGHSLLALKELA